MTTLVKSRYSDPAIEGHGFVNHIHHTIFDAGIRPGTQTPLIEAYKIELIQKLQALTGTGGRPRNIALFRKVLSNTPTEGKWDLLHMWTEGVDYEDSSAAGSISIDPITGTVHVIISFGNAVGNLVQYQPWEATIPRSQFAAPIERSNTVSYIPAPNESVRVFFRNNTPYDGDTIVDLAPFDIKNAVLLNLRLAIDGDIGRRLRAGPVISDPHTQDAALITVTVTDPHQRAYESGAINLKSNNQLLIRSDAGALRSVFVDVTGWFK